ncbi:hypothetical protein M0G74_09795 [Microbulbifer sp. CAU 1566]|uniref:hypothetical protein n=1 Tax=Microbulbifer sp. CAU 1566 TaxID=2933269 RepID=UPI002002A473|nr:hypothetical protein [Microbulbifer sp. CAU 1566]MCK7597558.1 hypothetical protein [Microbulbifer sp. CAU 1566]
MLVPHGFDGARRAQVWLGAFVESLPERLWLRCEPLLGNGGDLPAHESICRDIPVTLGQRVSGLRYGVISIPTLPACRYRLSLWQMGTDSNGNTRPIKLAEADLRGQPNGLGDGFNVWYGTCFYRHGDHGAMAEALDALPQTHRPDVSFLGGDQVYLDTAFSNTGFTLVPGFSTRNFSLMALRSRRRIRRTLNGIFSKEYRATWRGGLRRLLASGNHYFLAGDHEFWNDYPNPPGFLPVLWSRKVRDIWKDTARSLFDAYQLPQGQPSSQFDIGSDLSFFVLDTRLQREPGRDGRFTDNKTFTRMQQWLEGLRTPGVLVLPAPILTRWQFQTPGRGKALKVALGFGDHSLADTGQYQDLVRALNACTQDVLVLAGDVHFSRLAQFELNGKQVVEVVSSPLSCLPSAAAVPDQEPGHFPHRPTDDIRAQVRYRHSGSTRNERQGEISNNNFVTVRFTSVDDGVSAEVLCWDFKARDAQGAPKIDWEERHILLRQRLAESTSLACT